MANHHRTLGGGGGSRDLLRHFSASGIGGDESPTGEDDSGEIELSLGLSLGGSFGVDPRANRLVRSSSTNVACSLAPSLSARDVEEEEERRRRQALIRTCSLPVAADEEDDRKRRAGLVLGPGEAKRRRDMDGDGWGFVSGPWGGGVPPAATAVNTTNNGGDGGGLPKFPGRNGGVISFENGQLQAEKKSHQPPSHHSQPTPPRPALSPQSAKGSSRGVAAPPLTSQGSLGSQGSSLTAATPDSESRHTTQGYGQHVNSMDLSTVQPSTDRGIESAASIFPGSSLVSNNSGHVGEKPGGSSRSNGSLVMDRVIGDNMPSVFTKGDGPNGKIVEGFLYKYKKVEEVRIVCVCHGIFLTPAEFIKHAGGTDVAHPLRHIVVKPSASLL